MYRLVYDGRCAAARAALIVLTLLLGAAACRGQRPDDTADDVVSGHYVWGAEVNAFSPCGSVLEYWVTADPEIVQTLRDQYMAFQLPPYEAVFTTVRGEVGPVLDCGFCEEYDGSFRVAEVILMESPGPDDCVTGGPSNSNGA